jgi:hypothetical protein
MSNCGLSLPCDQTSPSDPSTEAVLRITSGDNGSAIVGNCPGGGTGVLGLSVNNLGTARGIAVQGTAQMGVGGQFQSGGGIGVEAAAGLLTGDDPRIHGIGVSATGDSVGVQASSSRVAVEASSEGGTAGVFRTSINQNFGFNNNTALDVGTTGTGAAASVHIDNPDNDAPALDVLSRGTGQGAVIVSSSGAKPKSFKPALLVLAETGYGLVVFAEPCADFFGTVDATAKNFRIDHPLDPANKYLVHSGVESSERACVYSGNVVLDDKGEAVVNLPAWFEALNEDFRYQLTCVGGSAPVYVVDEVANNHFRIGGGTSGMKVSWQLTGIRKDAWAKAHPLGVEEDKPQEMKGYFRHPELFGSDRQHSILHLSRPG